MNLSNNYSNAMMRANEEVRNIQASVITRQIIRDKLFGMYAGDAQYLSSPIVWGIPLKSFIKLIKSRNIKVCRENLITEGFQIEGQVSFRSTINPISILRLLMTIRYIIYKKNNSIKISQRKKKIINLGVNEEKIVSTLYITLFCANFLKKYNFNLFYFSLGTPQYLRYFTDRCHEIQHGVVHDYHPAANPIARSRGQFYVCKKYISCNFALLRKINSLQFQCTPIVQRLKGASRCIYIEGWPESSPFVERYLNTKYSNYDILRHPNNEPMFSRVSVAKRLDLIASASKIYIGLTTVLIDLNDDKRVTVVVTVHDLQRHQLIADKNSVLSFVNERYGVTAYNVLFIE